MATVQRELAVTFNVTTPLTSITFETISFSTTHVASVESTAFDSSTVAAVVGEFSIEVSVSYPETYQLLRDLEVRFNIRALYTKELNITFNVRSPLQLLRDGDSLRLRSAPITGVLLAADYLFVVVPVVGGVSLVNEAATLRTTLIGGRVLWWNHIGAEQYLIYGRSSTDTVYTLLGSVNSAPWSYHHA